MADITREWVQSRLRTGHNGLLSWDALAEWALERDQAARDAEAKLATSWDDGYWSRHTGEYEASDAIMDAPASAAVEDVTP